MQKKGKPEVRNPLRVEIAANAAFIVCLPLFVRLLDWWKGGVFLGLSKALGLDNDYQRLAGLGGVADIVQVPAAARALLDPNSRAYDPMEFLVAKVGLQWPAFVPDQAMRSYTHPPFEFPLGLPLANIDYLVWLPFWMTAMMVCLAVSMRLVGIQAVYAYPVALAFIATYPGRESLVTSYPLAGLLLGLAWYFRTRPAAGGTSLAILGGLRGYGLILLAYPLWKRSWKTLAWAAGVLIALLAVAIILEPTVLADFLDRGMYSANLWVEYQNNNAPFRFLAPLGIPYWTLVLGCAVVVAIGWRLGRNPFWLLAWASLAVTPLAWVSTLGCGLPLAAWVSRKGPGGTALMITSLAFVIGTPGGWGVSWSIFVLLTGIGLLFLGNSSGERTEPDKKVKSRSRSARRQ